MDDYKFQNFLQGLLEKKSKNKGLTIIPKNFEELQVKLQTRGKMDLESLAGLYAWAQQTLKLKAHELDFFATYHKDSYRFWNKIKKDNEGNYSVGLDLEDVLESEYGKQSKEKLKGLDTFIPDNYELAKKVMTEFNIETDNKFQSSFEDTSFREYAVWKTKDKKAAIMLGNFIQEKYIEPVLIELMKRNKVKHINFDNKNKMLDFVYHK